MIIPEGSRDPRPSDVRKEERSSFNCSGSPTERWYTVCCVEKQSMHDLSASDKQRVYTMYLLKIGSND